MTAEERAYDLLNRVADPGWGDEITAALADAIREHGEQRVAEERESIAVLVETWGGHAPSPQNRRGKLAAAIRARGEDTR